MERTPRITPIYCYSWRKNPCVLLLFGGSSRLAGTFSGWFLFTLRRSEFSQAKCHASTTLGTARGEFSPQKCGSFLLGNFPKNTGVIKVGPHFGGMKVGLSKVAVITAPWFFAFFFFGVKNPVAFWDYNKP